MPPKPRQVKIEQRSALASMQALETKSDEELIKETRFKSAAQAILGARAAERYDGRATRAYYQRALAAARPQERMQLRRMADASIALAERRAGDLKDAVTRLGQTPPSDRQLLMLRFMGLVAPPPGSSVLLRLRGYALILAIVVGLLLIGLGLAELVSLPFGGVSLIGGIFLGLVIVIAVLGVMALLGRRKQARARAAAVAGRR
jgi:ribosomal protein L12E/L44/L45/RPP1/RPP2